MGTVIVAGCAVVWMFLIELQVERNAKRITKLEDDLEQTFLDLTKISESHNYVNTKLLKTVDEVYKKSF